MEIATFILKIENSRQKNIGRKLCSKFVVFYSLLSSSFDLTTTIPGTAESPILLFRFRCMRERRLQHNRSEKKYNNSTILKNDAPIKSPSKPPQLARKSVGPYNSERFDVMN